MRRGIISCLDLDSDFREVFSRASRKIVQEGGFECLHFSRCSRLYWCTEYLRLVIVLEQDRGTIAKGNVEGFLCNFAGNFGWGLDACILMDYNGKAIA